MSIQYKGIEIPHGYRLDFIVADKVIEELKSVAALQNIHEAQMITYLKISGIRLGLLINFNVPRLKNGIQRIILDQPPIFRQPRSE